MENIKLETVLKNGDIVRARRMEGKKWNTNIVFDVKSDMLTLDAGMKEECYDLMKIGDKVECKVTTDEFEYVMNAIVSGVEANPIQTVALKILEIKRYDNVRKDDRHFVYLFTLIRKKEDDRDPIFSVVTDISKGGIAVTIDNKNNLKKGVIKVNDEVYFEISLEDQRKIEFKGIIKREKKSKTSLEYGVQIIEIDDDNRKILDDYVDELKNTDDEFQQLKQEIWEYNFSI